MSCATCGAAEGLDLCLFCGRNYCSLHRANVDGSTSCTDCVKAEQELKRAAKRKREDRAQARATAREQDATRDEPPTTPPPPLPEPPGLKPVIYGLLAASPTALYLWFFFAWLGEKHGLHAAVQPLATLLGGLFAFLGVWAITKTKLAGGRKTP